MFFVFVVIFLHQSGTQVGKDILAESVLLESDRFAKPILVQRILLRVVVVLWRRFFSLFVRAVKIKPHSEIQRVVLVIFQGKPVVLKQVAVRPSSIAVVDLRVFLDHVLVFGGQREIRVGIFELEPAVVFSELTLTCGF
jgi:hypothetical protein